MYRSEICKEMTRKRRHIEYYKMLFQKGNFQINGKLFYAHK